KYVSATPIFFIGGKRVEKGAEWGSKTDAELAELLGSVGTCSVAEIFVPEDAKQFMRWCEEKGYDTPDFKGVSCWKAIYSAYALFKGHSAACRSFFEQDPEPTNRAIYEWMRSHPEKVYGTQLDTVQRAIKMLFKCSLSVR